MKNNMREAVIVSAVRSPVGKLCGSLSEVKAEDLAAVVLKEAVKRAQIAPEKIDEVFFSTVMAKQFNNVARVAALEAGIPESVPAISMDRQCASSLNAVAYASYLIEAGCYDCVAVGGVDMDTRKPWIFGRTEKAYQLQPPALQIPMVASKKYGKDADILLTAEKIAEQFGITREECDKFALESHRKAIEAWEDHRFDEQIVPIEIKDRKGNVVSVFEKDEIMRESTLEVLAKLRTASGVPGGLVTAGNSSPLCDGAAAAVVMECSMAEELGCDLMGKIIGYAAAGVDPTIMGIGPVYATRKVFEKTGYGWDDIDLIEMNEAFASQSLACVKELNMPTEKLNPNGGAIALGHPFGATGAILTAKMLYELRRQNKKRGLISFCVAGGQGVAVIIERI